MTKKTFIFILMNIISFKLFAQDINLTNISLDDSSEKTIYYYDFNEHQLNNRYSKLKVIGHESDSITISCDDLIIKPFHNYYWVQPKINPCVLSVCRIHIFKHNGVNDSTLLKTETYSLKKIFNGMTITFGNLCETEVTFAEFQKQENLLVHFNKSEIDSIRILSFSIEVRTSDSTYNFQSQSPKFKLDPTFKFGSNEKIKGIIFHEIKVYVKYSNHDVAGIRNFSPLVYKILQ